MPMVLLPLSACQPPAMQKVGLVHDTAVARRSVVAGEGSWVTD